MPLGPGSVVGRYRLLELLGRGGMGVVYRAQDTELHRDVAVKLLAPQLAIDPNFVDRFRREARLAAGLRHPNVVVVHDWGTQDEQPYLVMELLDGRSLKQVIQERGRLPLAEAAGLVAQCADALDYAHSRGLVHRDVKPANIMVDPSGRAVLTDFGVARAASSPSLTSTGGIIGTPEYLSPEQALGRPVDGRADQYALGIVLYEALAGRTPFAADSTPAIIHLQVYSPPPRLAEARPDLPPTVLALVERALEKDPERRFPSAGAFGQALRAAAQGWAAGSPPSPNVASTPFAPPSPAPVAAPGAPPVPSPAGAAATAGSEGGPALWRYGALAIMVVGVLFATARFGLGLGAPKPEATATPRPTAVVAATATPAVSAGPVAAAASATPSDAASAQAVAGAPRLFGASPTPLVPVLPSPSPTVDPAVVALQTADGLAVQDLNVAIAQYRQLLDQDSKNAAAQRQLGVALFWQNHSREAVSALEQATSLTPRDALAWAYLAAAYIDDAQYQKSTQAAARADQADPSLAESKAALALNEVFERNKDAGRRWTEEALRIDPNSLLGLLARAQLAELENDPTASLETRRKLVELRPRWGSTNLQLAYGHHHAEREEETLQSIQTAQQVDPQTHGTQALRGFVLTRREQYDEARQAFQQELQRNPRSALSQAGLGWVAFIRGEYEAALDAFRKASTLDPRSVDAFEGIGYTLSNGFGQHLEAEANFRRALELFPYNATAWAGLGISQFKRQQWEPALESFRKASELNPKNAEFHRWAAYTLMEAGRFSEARQELDQIKALNPDDPGLSDDYAALKQRGG